MTAALRLLSQASYGDQEITSPGVRGLLALLAADLRTGSSTARLADRLWPGEQPENPTKAVQILVSRARSQFGADLIVTTPTGYRLALSEDLVDAAAALEREAESARHARAGDHAAALEHAEAGLALWNGATPPDDLSNDPLSALRAERAATYSALERYRAMALARLGRYAEAVEPLAVLARERPRDEELLLELLRSEAATAGAATALARYERYRRTLRDELGADPGADVQALHHDLLRSTAPPDRRGIAHEPNPLLGRSADIEAVNGLLRTSRVSSIVGPGGIGKTRLAHAVWRQAEQRVGFLVALGGVTADDEVVAEVASALGVRESRSRPAGHTPGSGDIVAGIVGVLRAEPTLLVLDNCEHVIRGAAELVRALVAMTEDLRVLTTSRAPLGLSSEAVHLLPELTLATSVELFEQRARAARPDVELPDDAVTEVCRHLDGLPLAVELAAARVRVMSVREIAQRIDDRFKLLRGGPRDAPHRHQTLRAVVAWSWNLLESNGQAAMRALSVLPGGFTAASAPWLLGADNDHDVLAVLEELVEQSLVKVIDTPLGVRFQMLETVREFAAAEREAAGDDARVFSSLAAWARHLGSTLHEAPFGADPYSAIELIRAEQDNLAFVLRHSVARTDGPAVAATAALLGALWVIESNYPRMSNLAEETSWLLSHYRPETELVAVARTALLLIALYTFVTEGPRAVRAVAALRRLPPAPPTTFPGAATAVLGAVHDDPAALDRLSHSEEPLVAGGANAIVSYYWESEHRLDEALLAAERMLAAFGKRDLPWLQALAHSRIGELCFQAEQGDRAREHLIAALPVIERLGAWSDVVGIRWWIVLANLQRGAVDEAEEWADSITGIRADQKVGTLGYGLGAQAEVRLANGETEEGLRLWRHVVDLLRNSEDSPSIGVPADLDPWALEARCVAVVAHAQHDRLDLVREVVEELPDRLATLLETPIANPPPYLMEIPLSGTLLLALAVAKLDRAGREADPTAVASAVRVIALAERLGFLRNFHPTMSSTRIRQLAERAGQSAYAEAVSSYADLSRDQLRVAVVAALRELG